jgi:hypothetical protein
MPGALAVRCGGTFDVSKTYLIKLSLVQVPDQRLSLWKIQLFVCFLGHIIKVPTSLTNTHLRFTLDMPFTWRVAEIP